MYLLRVRTLWAPGDTMLPRMWQAYLGFEHQPADLGAFDRFDGAGNRQPDELHLLWNSRTCARAFGDCLWRDRQSPT